MHLCAVFIAQGPAVLQKLDCEHLAAHFHMRHLETQQFGSREMHVFKLKLVLDIL